MLRSLQAVLTVARKFAYRNGSLRPENPPRESRSPENRSLIQSTFSMPMLDSVLKPLRIQMWIDCRIYVLYNHIYRHDFHINDRRYTAFFAIPVYVVGNGGRSTQLHTVISRMPHLHQRDLEKTANPKSPARLHFGSISTSPQQTTGTAVFLLNLYLLFASRPGGSAHPHKLSLTRTALPVKLMTGTSRRVAVEFRILSLFSTHPGTHKVNTINRES